MKAYNLEMVQHRPLEVQELYLHGRPMATLPEVLRQFRNLRRLEVTQCGLQEVPGWLLELKELRELNVSDNQLTEVPAWLFQMPLLHQIDLANNRLETLPPEIADWTDGRGLDLSGNQFTDFPSGLGKLTSLEALYFSDNPLRSLPGEVENWQRLRTLDLSGNELSRLGVGVRAWEALEVLDLSKNRLKKLPEALGQCARLRRLIVSDNRLVALPDSLGACRQLDVLNVKGNRLEALPNSIWKLPLLRDLDVGKNRLRSDSVPPAITPALQYLTLANNQLDRVPTGLQSGVRLRKLDLANNQLQVLPDWIANWTQLQEINLRNNQLEQLPQAISQLVQLEKMWLNRNSLSEISDTLFSLPRINGLSGLKGARSFLKLQASLQAARVPEAIRPQLWEVYQGKRTDLEELEEQSLLLLLGVSVTLIRQAALEALFRQQDLSSQPLQAGCQVVIHGKSKLPVSFWSARLEQAGITRTTQIQPETTHVVMAEAKPVDVAGRSLQLTFLSERDLRRELERLLGEGWLETAEKRQLTRVQRLMTSGQASDLKLVLPMLREGGLPNQLKTDVLLQARWGERAAIRRAFRGLFEIYANDREVEFLQQLRGAPPGKEEVEGWAQGTHLEVGRIYAHWLAPDA
jgi:leucine-rich repeat protein SHOC2